MRSSRAPRPPWERFDPMTGPPASCLPPPPRRWPDVSWNPPLAGESWWERPRVRSSIWGARRARTILLGAPARALARAARASGPCFATSAACASSAVALGEGLALIEDGICDEVIVGGTEALHAFVYRGFHALRALSPRPAMPFDVERAGLSLGEGAAVLVLESLSHARTHGRRPIAVVEGFGSSSDGYDQVAPEPGGRGLLAASRRALSAAGVTVEDVGGYHAHGTGTIQNDRMEAAAFTALFSGREVTVSAIKGSLGHTLGAGAALDVAVCALILRAEDGASGHESEGR